MKTIYLFLILLIGSLFTSCVFNEADELTEKKLDQTLVTQDIKFQMNESIQKLKITFFISSFQDPMNEVIPITVKLLDEEFKDIGVFVSDYINKQKDLIYKESDYKESILIDIPKGTIISENPLYIDITVNKVAFPRVRYVYTKIDVPDWIDGPTIGC